MNVVALKIDEETFSYTYIINPGFSPNCKRYDYELFEEVNLNNEFFLFIGCIYTGQDIGNANSLAEIARHYPKLDFYFKLVFDEFNVRKVVPNQITVPKLPIIIYVKNGKIVTISNGVIHKDSLWKEIESLLHGNSRT